jgi:2,3-bisphosphoglycerate-dependent phosphoglycerate mutase
MAVELVFETHATTEDNETGIATGWLPGRLSGVGRAQARDLGRRRANDGLAAIFSSDLRRAMETVEIGFPNSPIPVLYDWRLRECDYGRRNGGSVETLDRPTYVDRPYPDGESWQQAVARVQRFTLDLEPRWAGRRVLVVGHTATRWALDHLTRGERLDELVAAPFDWQPGWEYLVGSGI